MDELFFKKTKFGWQVSDKNGNVATGLTRDMAKNQWYALYKSEVVSDVCKTLVQKWRQ